MKFRSSGLLRISHGVANTVKNFAARSRKILPSSEVDEKRQLLDLVFQNLQLKDESLSFSVRKSSLTMMDFKNCPKEWGWLDSNQRKPGAERFTVSCNWPLCDTPGMGKLDAGERT